jgi:hypothetical protein
MSVLSAHRRLTQHLLDGADDPVFVRQKILLNKVRVFVPGEPVAGR